ARGQPPIVEVLVTRPAPDATHPVQFPRLARGRFLAVAGGRLDDAQHPWSRHHVVQHRQIARLEHVERQTGAWQQDGAAQGKNGGALRQGRWSTIALENGWQGVDPASGEEDGGEAAPAVNGCRVLWPPGVEKLYQLLACGLLVPFAVATEALEQLCDGFLLLARRS